MRLQILYNSVFLSIICLPADLKKIVNGITAIVINFPFIIKRKVTEIRNRTVELFGYIAQEQSFPHACAPDVREHPGRAFGEPDVGFSHSVVWFVICMLCVLSKSPLHSIHSSRLLFVCGC